MAYAAAPVRVPMKPSPALVYNNLSFAGGSLCFATDTQACMVQAATLKDRVATPVRVVDAPLPGVIIHSVCALPHGETGFVLIATDSSVQVWDKLARHLLYEWMPPPAVRDGNAPEGSNGSSGGVGRRHKWFARGAAINIADDSTANICFGDSSGALHVLAVDELGNVSAPVRVTHHASPVTALGTAYQSRRGRWADGLSSALVSADEGGDISVWAARAATGYSPAGGLGPGGGVPAIALAVRSGHVIAARLDGRVQVFSLDRRQLHAELSLHSRWLSSMDLHPTKDLIATGAEDGTIAVTAIPVGAQKAAAVMSVVWMHCSVTGVAFCGPTLDDVAAVSWDTDELRVYKPTCPT